MGKWPLTCGDANENRCVMTSADDPAKDFARTQKRLRIARLDQQGGPVFSRLAPRGSALAWSTSDSVAMLATLRARIGRLTCRQESSLSHSMSMHTAASPRGPEVRCCGGEDTQVVLTMAFGIERRALHRMRVTERNAGSRDGRNLEDEYRDPTRRGHAHPTFRGHGLQAAEKVRRHVCCWFSQGAGAGWSSAKWSKIYITDSRLLIQSSSAAVVSLWWTPSLRFFEDLTAGRVTLNDRGQVILVSGTQVEVLAGACRHMRDAP